MDFIRQGSILRVKGVKIFFIQFQTGCLDAACFTLAFG